MSHVSSIIGSDVYTMEYELREQKKSSDGKNASFNIDFESDETYEYQNSDGNTRNGNRRYAYYYDFQIRME